MSWFCTDRWGRKPGPASSRSWSNPPAATLAWSWPPRPACSGRASTARHSTRCSWHSRSSSKGALCSTSVEYSVQRRTRRGSRSTTMWTHWCRCWLECTTSAESRTPPSGLTYPSEAAGPLPPSCCRVDNRSDLALLRQIGLNVENTLRVTGRQLALHASIGLFPPQSLPGHTGVDPPKLESAVPNPPRRISLKASRFGPHLASGIMRSDIPSKELSRSENLAPSIVIVRTGRNETRRDGTKRDETRRDATSQFLSAPSSHPAGSAGRQGLITAALPAKWGTLVASRMLGLLLENAPHPMDRWHIPSRVGSGLAGHASRVGR